LLLRRPSGREAYPGDIFYLHAKLLERAVNLSYFLGGGSLTAFPIVETAGGDISSYIPTNVISITDGQIYLESTLFFNGIQPAVNLGLSVSRIGSAAQYKILGDIVPKLKSTLAQYREVEYLKNFEEDLDYVTLGTLVRGSRLTVLLTQGVSQPYLLVQEFIVMYAGVYGFLDEVKLEDVKDIEYRLVIKPYIIFKKVLKKLDFFFLYYQITNKP
jgi:proton translocating ATP synthase F1 alpha subunit